MSGEVHNTRTTVNVTDNTLTLEHFRELTTGRNVNKGTLKLVKDADGQITALRCSKHHIWRSVSDPTVTDEDAEDLKNALTGVLRKELEKIVDKPEFKGLSDSQRSALGEKMESLLKSFVDKMTTRNPDPKTHTLITNGVQRTTIGEIVGNIDTLKGLSAEELLDYDAEALCRLLNGTDTEGIAKDKSELQAARTERTNAHENAVNATDNAGIGDLKRVGNKFLRDCFAKIAKAVTAEPGPTPSELTNILRKFKDDLSPDDFNKWAAKLFSKAADKEICGKTDTDELCSQLLDYRMAVGSGSMKIAEFREKAEKAIADAFNGRNSGELKAINETLRSNGIKTILLDKNGDLTFSDGATENEIRQDFKRLIGAVALEEDERKLSKALDSCLTKGAVTQALKGFTETLGAAEKEAEMTALSEKLGETLGNVNDRETLRKAANAFLHKCDSSLVNLAKELKSRKLKADEIESSDFYMFQHCKQKFNSAFENAGIESFRMDKKCNLALEKDADVNAIKKDIGRLLSALIDRNIVINGSDSGEQKELRGHLNCGQNDKKAVAPAMQEFIDELANPKLADYHHIPNNEPEEEEISTKTQKADTGTVKFMKTVSRDDIKRDATEILRAAFPNILGTGDPEEFKALNSKLFDNGDTLILLNDEGEPTFPDLASDEEIRTSFEKLKDAVALIKDEPELNGSHSMVEKKTSSVKTEGTQGKSVLEQVEEELEKETVVAQKSNATGEINLQNGVEALHTKENSTKAQSLIDKKYQELDIAGKHAEITEAIKTKGWYYGASERDARWELNAAFLFKCLDDDEITKAAAEDDHGLFTGDDFLNNPEYKEYRTEFIEDISTFDKSSWKNPFSCRNGYSTAVTLEAYLEAINKETDPVKREQLKKTLMPVITIFADNTVDGCGMDGVYGTQEEMTVLDLGPDWLCSAKGSGYITVEEWKSESGNNVKPKIGTGRFADKKRNARHCPYVKKDGKKLSPAGDGYMGVATLKSVNGKPLDEPIKVLVRCRAAASLNPSESGTDVSGNAAYLIGDRRTKNKLPSGKTNDELESEAMQYVAEVKKQGHKECKKTKTKTVKDQVAELIALAMADDTIAVFGEDPKMSAQNLITKYKSGELTAKPTKGVFRKKVVGESRLEKAQRDYYEQLRMKFRLDIIMAKAKGGKIYTGGAIGCGAFNNNPKVVILIEAEEFIKHGNGMEYVFPRAGDENTRVFLEAVKKVCEKRGVPYPEKFAQLREEFIKIAGGDEREYLKTYDLYVEEDSYLKSLGY